MSTPIYLARTPGGAQFRLDTAPHPFEDEAEVPEPTVVLSLSEAQMNAAVIEWLRGRTGPPGPQGPMGVSS